MLCMNIIQSQPNLFYNCLSCLYRKRWIIIYQRKQIAFKVLVNEYIFLCIFVYVDSEARIIPKIVFKLLQQIKD